MTAADFSKNPLIFEFLITVNVILRRQQDIARLGPAIKQQIKGAKIGDKIAPQLRIDRVAGFNGAQLDAGFVKRAAIEIPGGRSRRQIR